MWMSSDLRTSRDGAESLLSGSLLSVVMSPGASLQARVSVSAAEKVRRMKKPAGRFFVGSGFFKILAMMGL
jgi:hypothetical protein